MAGFMDAIVETDLRMNLTDLKNIHAGETIWVLGSGSSLEHVSPDFFDDKIVIATNLVAQSFPLKNFFLFSHYHPAVKMQLDDPGLIQAVTHDLCSTRWSGLLSYSEGEWCFGRTPPKNVILNHLTFTNPPGSDFDPWRHIRSEEIVFGSSSIHGSMHLAAYMGANHIMLVGADCGQIDGANRITGYPTGHAPWGLYNKHLIAMKKWINEEYDATVMSLNPFVNFNLEGHKFTGV